MIRTTIAAAALLVAGSAAADQFKFSYTQQDFSSPEAVMQLHERIKSSARSYCNKEFFVDRTLGQVDECVEDVVTKLVDSIDDRRLFATTEQTNLQSS